MARLCTRAPRDPPETRVRANAFDSGEIGTPVAFEDTFGLHDEPVFRMDASWRLVDRHL